MLLQQRGLGWKDGNLSLHKREKDVFISFSFLFFFRGSGKGSNAKFMRNY